MAKEEHRIKTKSWCIARNLNCISLHIFCNETTSYASHGHDMYEKLTVKEKSLTVQREEKIAKVCKEML